MAFHKEPQRDNGRPRSDMVAIDGCVDQGDLLGTNDSQIVNHVSAHDRVAKKGTKRRVGSRQFTSYEGFHALTAAGQRSHARANLRLINGSASWVRSASDLRNRACSTITPSLMDFSRGWIRPRASGLRKSWTLS